MTLFPEWLAPPQMRLPNRPYGRGVQDWQAVQGLFAVPELRGQPPATVLPEKQSPAVPRRMPAPNMVAPPAAPPEAPEPVAPLRPPAPVPAAPQLFPQRERLRPLDYAGLAAIMQSMLPRNEELRLQPIQPSPPIPGRSPQAPIDPILLALAGGKI